MGQRVFRAPCVYRASFLAAASLTLSVPVAASDPEAGSSATLQAITVTGEKADRSAFDTITGTTVFTEDDIRKSTDKNALDLIQETPNVTIGGYGGIANIRGVDGNGGGKSSYSWVGATRPRTATVIDGVNQIWTGGNVLNNALWDVEQVEVLRGPQSTSQGRSAIGGAIVVKTRDPSFQNEGAIRLGMEQANDKNQYRTAAMLSGPMTDDLAYRLSADYVTGEDFIDYIDNSDNLDYNTDPDDVTSADLKAKLLWEPASISGLSARFDIQHQQQEGPYLHSVISGDDGDYEAPMLDADGNSAVNHRIGDTTMDTYISNIQYAINPDIRATLITSYSQFDSEYYHNQENRSFKMDSWDQDTINVEGRINFLKNGSDLGGLIGVSAIRDDQDLHLYYVDDDGDYSSDLFLGDTRTTTLSVFGEADYSLTDRLDVIVGGRVENESQERNAEWLGVATGLDNDDRDDTYLLPKVAFLYTLSENHNIGLDVRRGYTPGGLGWDRNNRSSGASNTAYEYDPEYVTAVELSSKNRFWDNRASLNLNAFYNDYTDYQAYAGSGVEFGDGTTGGGIANVDKATTYGLELEARVSVTELTEVFANASVLHTEVDEYDANPDWEGNELPFAANQTFGAGIDQRFTDALSGRVSVKHVGEYYDDLDNDSGADDGSDKVGDYNLVNVALAYELGNATLQVYANNLTNEYVVTYNDGLTQNVLAPRTIGATVDYTF